MNTRPYQSIVIAFLLFSVPVLADRLELSNGTVEEGELLGIDNAILMFRTEEGVQAYPLSEVTGLSFHKVSSTSAAKEASPEPKAPKETTLTIPSGTRLVVRTLETVDSSKHKVGHRFRGALEGAITVNGVTVVPRGATVQGRVIQASQGGRVAGSSELAVELVDIMINDELHPIATNALQAKTDNEAKNTARRTARAGVIGGLIDGSDGAKTGAKVGLGVSVLTKGSSIHIPSGTIMETNLRTPVTVKR